MFPEFSRKLLPIAVKLNLQLSRPEYVNCIQRNLRNKITYSWGDREDWKHKCHHFVAQIHQYIAKQEIMFVFIQKLKYVCHRFSVNKSSKTNMQSHKCRHVNAHCTTHNIRALYSDLLFSWKIQNELKYEYRVAMRFKNRNKGEIYK